MKFTNPIKLFTSETVCGRCASRIAVQQALSGLTGVISIYDDIIVHGKHEEEHNRNLELLLRRIQARGLTLNVDKCHFNMPQMKFMGHILSEHGIGVAESKVTANIRSTTYTEH
jgi:hypothetical protein